MSRLDAIRAQKRTAFQLMLMAKATGDCLLAAEADAQAVRERVAKGPHRLLPLEAEVTTQQAVNVLQAGFMRGMSGSSWVTR